MPNYLFSCVNGHEHEAHVSVAERDACRECPVCKADSARVFTPTAATIIPAYMQAPGSRDSSADFCDRQSAYLKSDRWRKEREKIDAAGGSVRLGGS